MDLFSIGHGDFSMPGTCGLATSTLGAGATHLRKPGTGPSWQWATPVFGWDIFRTMYYKWIHTRTIFWRQIRFPEGRLVVTHGEKPLGAHGKHPEHDDASNSSFA